MASPLHDARSDIHTAYDENDAVGLAELVRAREIEAVELVEEAVRRIEQLNPALNAVVHKLYDQARQAAKNADLDAPLAGVPFLLKELGCPWEGVPNTNASAYFKNVISTFDCQEARNLKRAGLILVGKSNAPENGWSISTEPRLYGPTRNPWAPGITPGGSSGGSSAAIASRMVPLATATDAAGSIRIPASCCGLVGLKPSRGRVSPAPAGDVLNGGAYSLCMSRTVRDTAAYLDAVAGSLPGDTYHAPVPGRSWLEMIRRPVSRLRIGFHASGLGGVGVAPEVASAVGRTAKVLEEMGHSVEEHDLTLDAASLWEAYSSMAFVQTAALYRAMEPLVGHPVREEDVEPVTWAILQHAHGLDALTDAMNVEHMRQESRRVADQLAGFDAYITPTMPTLPMPLGYYDMSDHDLERYREKTYAGTVFSFPFNVAGLPAISLPLAWSDDSIPIGVQIVGRFGDEATLLALSARLEREMAWSGRMPPIVAQAK